MADPITWYALGRTIEDTESVLEAVDAKILAHNLDPSAHGQTSEAIYEHRNPYSLDHPLSSIYARHIASDLSYIDQNTMTSNVTAGMYTAWVTLTELTQTFMSGKAGSVLMLCTLYAKSLGEGEDLYVRFKVTRNGAVSYYPSADGLVNTSLRGLAFNEIGSVIFSWITQLEAGGITLEVQASTDAGSVGNPILGTPANVSSNFMIITVGSDITT